MKNIDSIIKEFRLEIEKIYGSKLKKIILYGSWARQEAKEDSDIDIGVVLKAPVIPGREIDRMINVISDLNLKHGVVISVYPVSESNYLNLNSPLLMNLRREGISR